MMISPGMVETEFSLVRWNQNQEKANATYQGMTPLIAHDVASEIVRMVTNPRHLLIDDLVLLSAEKTLKTILPSLWAGISIALSGV